MCRELINQRLSRLGQDEATYFYIGVVLLHKT